MTSRRYVTADVFTDRAFGGNPLAVVLDADGLSDVAMQALAAEFAYPETTFVLTPADPLHTARVRIFTPNSELPFAGHPNVGTAFVLATLGQHRGRAVEGHVVFEEAAGLVPVDILTEDGRPVGARLTAPRPLSRGPALPVADIAACAQLAAADIVTARHAPATASVGASLAFAEVPDLATLQRARPDAAAAARLPPGTVGLYLYTFQPGGGMAAGTADVRARMFAPGSGIPEDPATGAAAAAFVALMADLAPEPDLDLDLRIAQGIEMGRPSLIEASAAKAGGQVGRVRVGGRCVRMMEGSFDLG